MSIEFYCKEIMKVTTPIQTSYVLTGENTGTETISTGAVFTLITRYAPRWSLDSPPQKTFESAGTLKVIKGDLKPYEKGNIEIVGDTWMVRENSHLANVLLPKENMP